MERKRHISLTDMRNIQLEILDRIDNVCRKNGLRYSLGGGTLLGAIRHKGYIPWDDDIDIMLPRTDYESFLAVFDGLYPHLTLQHYKNDDTYYFLFAKVYDNRTCLIEENTKGGVYVDVFPIDGLPPEIKLPDYLNKLYALKENLIKSTKFYKFKNGYLMHVKYLIKQLLYPSRTKIINLLDNHFNSFPFESSEYAGAITGIYKEKEHMQASVFKDYTEVSFEGHKYMAISGYDSYLTKHYGDYMKLPPLEQQVSNHSYEVFWK